MNRTAATALVAVTQLLLIGVAIAPQASARLTGESYVLRVAPVDPFDPYRGAYVALRYPDLRPTKAQRQSLGPRPEFGSQSKVYLTLRPEGEVWVADEFSRTRPEGEPYLACERDWGIRCGIESWFLPQDQARQMEDDLSNGAYAELKVDGRGTAALVDVRETP